MPANMKSMWVSVQTKCLKAEKAKGFLFRKNLLIGENKYTSTQLAQFYNINIMKRELILLELK